MNMQRIASEIQKALRSFEWESVYLTYKTKDGMKTERVRRCVYHRSVRLIRIEFISGTRMLFGAANLKDILSIQDGVRNSTKFH